MPGTPYACRQRCSLDNSVEGTSGRCNRARSVGAVAAVVVADDATFAMIADERVVHVPRVAPDAAGHVVTPVTAPTWVTPVKGSSTTLPIDESVYTDAPDSGTLYRWTSDHWQYNWKTDVSQAGYYWRVGVRLDDGSMHVVTIALR